MYLKLDMYLLIFTTSSFFVSVYEICSRFISFSYIQLCKLLDHFLVLFQLNLQGYNDKQHILLQKVLDKMTSFEIDPQRFNILLENVSCNFKKISF